MSQHQPASSDSEDDPDYVPPAEDADSSESDDDAVAPQASVEESKEDLDEKKKARGALWASFQASVSTSPIQQETTKKLVKVEKKYLFAGKHVIEVVEVPEDSEDAKKWPLWQPQPSPSPQPTAEQPVSVEVAGSGSSSVASGTPPAPGKRPGPRKARTALPSLPKAGQAKKITTLDKSAMDWRTHLSSQSSDVQDELNANRRGGGYLEKVEFLKRVEDRREDVLEASKSAKRRKT
ncbi:bucentaur or craniofacial development-domain-containing protein [Phlebopus sp. FC_14]|nr:bucentaur or craniofacial development-domain-containing protein [Phlebopus sp. FC_14]